MQSNASPYTILYVDDEPQLLDIGKVFLERSGLFTVETSQSAGDALTILKKRRFDAIICDFQMPNLNGMDFLKKVRAQYGNIPFILFTSRAREEVVIEAIGNGADFYVQKGSDTRAQFAELAHKVQHAIRCQRAELNLLKSEERFSKVFHASPIHEMIIDAASGQIIEINSSFLNETGYVRNELLGKNLWELDLIIELQKGKATGELIRIGDNFRNTEMHIRKKSGGIITVLMSQETIDTGSQRIIVLQSVDITDQILIKNEVRQKTHQLIEAYNQLTLIQRELEKNFTSISIHKEKLQINEATQQALLNASPDLVCLYDTKGRIISINDTFAQVIGQSSSFLLGKNIFSQGFPVLISALRAWSETALTNLTPVSDIFEMNEHIFDIRVVPVIENGGIASRVAFIARDITKQKHLEEDLHRSEAKNRLLIDTLPEIINRLNRKEGLSKEYINGEISRLAGYPSDELT